MRLMTAAMLGLLVLIGACSGEGAVSDDRPLVVVTTTILGDIVENVTGEAARVEVLMPLGADPHAYEASARQAAWMREAVLIIGNGLGLEGGLLDVVADAEDDGVPVLLIGDFVDPMLFMGGSHEDDPNEGAAAEDHDHDDGLDPHVWMDPVRMQRAVDVIAETLGEVLGVDVTDSAARYRDELEQLSAEIEQQIGTIPEEHRKLVTNHFAYGYYADRFGLELVATVIPAATTEAETSSARFAELVEIVREEDVPAIFGSTTEPVQLAEAIADEVGREVEVVQLYTGSLGEPGSGAETYVDMMRSSTERIVRALG
jgi:zinc/manganese transport system substrate-binding protein